MHIMAACKMHKAALSHLYNATCIYVLRFIRIFARNVCMFVFAPPRPGPPPPLPTINKCALLTLPLFASAADALRSAMICERMRAPRDVSTKFGNIDEC